MQVRFANRQDEPNIRTFVESVYADSGRTFDLEGSDSDLRNIDAQYFGQEGLLIVVEEDKKIFGVAGARRKSEDVLELRRLLLDPTLKEGDTAAELIGIVVRFAPRLLYHKIVDGRFPYKETGEQNSGDEFADVLTSAGFTKENGNLALPVQADF